MPRSIEEMEKSDKRIRCAAVIEDFKSFCQDCNEIVPIINVVIDTGSEFDELDENVNLSFLICAFCGRDLTE